MDKPRIVSAEIIKSEDCPAGGKHRVFIGLTGDCYAQFCVNEGCNTKSNEYPKDIDWENF